MGRLLLFVILVSVGIYAVVMLSKSNTSTPTQNIEPTITGTSLLTATESGEERVNAKLPTSPEASPSPTLNLTPEQQSATTAAITTSKGIITVTFYPQDAPLTVRNFKQKAVSKFYDNLTFHRVEDWVLQGGDPLGNGTGGGSMPVEFNVKPFVVGSLGVASRGDNKVQNDAQFFITKTAASWLDGKYTNFGIVISGMDVAQKMVIGDKILGITLQ